MKICTLVALAGSLVAQEKPRHKVDLGEDEGERQVAVAQEPESGLATLGRQWFQNFELWGYGAVAYLDSGSDGWRPDGAAMVKDSSLYLEAESTDDISFFVQMMYARAGDTDDAIVRVRELYAHFRNLLKDEGSLNVKVGSFDIPFGEEYLRRDVINLPTISYSAAVPYGADEGVLGYGKCGDLQWFAAIMDGSLERGADSGSEKAYALKVGQETDHDFYWSASVMHTGRTSGAANCFGGIYLVPVGAFGIQSATGASPSAEISALLYSVDARIGSKDGNNVLLGFGQAKMSDPTPGFSRDLTWFLLEPMVRLTDTIYLNCRYSEFGTFDDRKGYVLHGRWSGAGATAFGFDAKRLQRLSMTLGYSPHQNLWIKAEVGRDRYWTIQQSATRPGSGNRHFFGFEVVLGF